MRDHTEGLFGALLGGLMSALVGAGVLSVLTRGGGDESLVVSSVLVGFGVATAFMYGAIYASVRAPWLATALLFAAGFTYLWSIGLSCAVEARGTVLLIIGTTVAAALGIGRRFGRGPHPEGVARDEAEWTP